jgi:hypothetical protein
LFYNNNDLEKSFKFIASSGGWAMFKHSARVLAICFFAILAFSPGLWADSIPAQINYQGQLTDSSGNAVADGTYSIMFNIYNAATGGTALWTETQPAVAVSKGLFNAQLGSVAALSTISNVNQALWLGVTVGTDSEMTPRHAILPSLYAANAMMLGGYSPGTGASNIPVLDATGKLPSSMINMPFPLVVSGSAVGTSAVQVSNNNYGLSTSKGLQSAGYTGISGTTYSSSNGIGVYGSPGAGGDGATTIGVWGASSLGTGVKGTSVSSNGVNGSSTSGIGVNGSSYTGTAVYASSYGGNGVQTSSSYGSGLSSTSTWGNAITASSNFGLGLGVSSANVAAISASTTAGSSAIYANTSAANVNYYGIQVNAPSASGILINASGTGVRATGTTYGVYADSSGTGVYGKGRQYGVYGWNDDVDGYGVYAQNGGKGTALYATSVDGFGILAENQNSGNAYPAIRGYAKAATAGEFRTDNDKPAVAASADSNEAMHAENNSIISPALNVLNNSADLGTAASFLGGIGANVASNNVKFGVGVSLTASNANGVGMLLSVPAAGAGILISADSSVNYGMWIGGNMARYNYYLQTPYRGVVAYGTNIGVQAMSTAGNGVHGESTYASGAGVWAQNTAAVSGSSGSALTVNGRFRISNTNAGYFTEPSTSGPKNSWTVYCAYCNAGDVVLATFYAGMSPAMTFSFTTYPYNIAVSVVGNGYFTVKTLYSGQMITNLSIMYLVVGK